MLVLGLERQPASELLPGTVSAWVDRLSRHGWGASDVPRIREAFGRLSESRRAWPAIPDFLEALPPRSEVIIPSRQWTEAERMANRRRLAQMVDELLADKGIES